MLGCLLGKFPISRYCSTVSERFKEVAESILCSTWLPVVTVISHGIRSNYSLATGAVPSAKIQADPLNCHESN